MILPFFYAIKTTRFPVITLFALLFFFLASFPLSAKTPALPDSAKSVRALLISDSQTVLSGEISASIKTIAVNIGDHFKKGALLVKLNCSIYQAELDKAQALQKEAVKVLEVNKKLENLSSISELEVAVAKTRLDQTIAETAIRKHQVTRCTIHAPFSGGVVARIAESHQYITPGQPLLEIIDTQNITVQMFAPSLWFKKISVSTPFTITIDEVEKEYHGKITALGARIDPASQTIEVRGKIEGKNPELLAGMSGSASFNLK